MAPSPVTKLSDVKRFDISKLTEESNISVHKEEISVLADDSKTLLDQLMENIDVSRWTEKPNVTFLPHDFGDQFQDLDTAVSIFLQIVAENILENVVNVSQMSRFNMDDSLKRCQESNVRTNFILRHINAIEDLETDVFADTDLLVGHNIFRDKSNIITLSKILHDNAFIITLEDKVCTLYRTNSFNIVSKIPIEGKTLSLLKKVPPQRDVSFIQTSLHEHMTWFANVQRDIKRNKKVVLVSERETHKNLRGFVKEMQTVYKNQIGLVEVHDYQSPPFDPEKEIFKKQLEKNLTYNVLSRGRWGGYYNLPTTQNSI